MCLHGFAYYMKKAIDMIDCAVEKIEELIRDKKYEELDIQIQSLKVSARIIRTELENLTEN